MEDQITKHTKQIYEIENENKFLQTKNIELTKKLEELDGGNQSLKFDLPCDTMGTGDRMECEDQTGEILQEIVLELEERIEV